MKKFMVIFTLCLLPFVLSTILSAQQPVKNADWSSWQFLLGEWVGEGGGNQPGQGAGSCIFHLDLQNRVLMRKNHSEFPASKERPAFSHDDLMIIYQEAGQTKAVYFDNEGHIIHYVVTFPEKQPSVVFESEATAPRHAIRSRPGAVCSTSTPLTMKGTPRSARARATSSRWACER